MCVLGSSFGLLTGVVSIGGDILYTIGALALVAIAGFFVVISAGDLIICVSTALGPRLQRHPERGTVRAVKRAETKTSEFVAAQSVSLHGR